MTKVGTVCRVIDDELQWLDATATAVLVRAGEITRQETVAAAIERIEALDPALGSVVIERFERARREAAAHADNDAVFAGVPMLLKDAGQELEGEPHYVGLAALRDIGHVSTRTTALVTRLQASGLVIVGRSKCPPFSAGVKTEPMGFSPCHNPYNATVVAGGSSGGSAAAVAAGLVPVAHGSDATGSLRYPASYCGVFTLKPSRGAFGPTIPCDGVDPLAIWTEYLLARSVRDLVAAWEPFTSSSLTPLDSLTRIAVLRHDPVAGLPVDPATVAAIDRVTATLERSGHDVRLDHPPALQTMTGDAMRRANGVLVRSSRVRSVLWLEALLGRAVDTRDVDAEILDLVRGGPPPTDVETIAAEAEHATFGATIAEWFAPNDVLVCPVTHGGPFAVGTKEPLGLGVFCAPFSFSGQAAMSIPVGMRADGTPIGVQLVGAVGSEGRLLALAAALEADGVAAFVRPHP